MSAKIPSEELHRLRNQIPLREIVTILCVPWIMEDELFRFKCPKCGQLHTSIHPTENLGRCFDCQVNFNAIDFVCHAKKLKFRSSVDWLQSLTRLRGERDYSTLVNTMARKSRMK